MITLDAFLVLLAAASLPVAYLWFLSRWIEPEDRKVNGEVAPPKPAQQTKLVAKVA